MATRVLMSKLSPTMEEGRVLQWLKKEGDSVESGEPLVEVETDKAVMEVEAMGSGVLRKVLVSEEATVPTGTVLGVIAADGEDISEFLEEIEAAGEVEAVAAADISPTETVEPPSHAAAQDQAPAETSPAQAPASPPSQPDHDGGRIKASPVARRMAQERGIALQTVQGTGPGGRIIKRDIEALARDVGAAPAAAPAVGAEVPFERVELTQIRKAIARNMAASLGPIPHFYLTTEIDMGRVITLRAELNKSLEAAGAKIGINEILMKTAAHALAAHPNVNVAFAGDHVRRFTRVDVGLAVAIPDGLITPVVRDVGAKGLQQLSIELADLVSRSREKRLKPEEYTGATFTISNLGMYGIDEFTAVINPPAATILAVGQTKEKPVVVDGSIEVRSRMRVTLSCDHRAVDGAMGAEFLATYKSMLENPLRLVL